MLIFNLTEQFKKHFKRGGGLYEPPLLLPVSLQVMSMMNLVDLSDTT